MTVRQRKMILSEVATDFKEYSLPRGITLEGYTTIVGKNPMRRTIKKNFKSWGRFLVALEVAYPDSFLPLESEPEPEPVNPILAALGEKDNG